MKKEYKKFISTQMRKLHAKRIKWSGLSEDYERDFIIEAIDGLKQKYSFINHDKVTRFLSANIDLIDILIDASQYIYSVFGNVPIYLELHCDPEEEWDELFIVIKTNYSPEKAVELENKFFDEWFVKVMSKVSGRLNFAEEPYDVLV